MEEEKKIKVYSNEIQVNHIKGISLDDTYAFLASITTEDIASLSNKRNCSAADCKAFFKLPDILGEEEEAHYVVAVGNELESDDLMLFAMFDGMRMEITAHLMLSAILIDKGPKGIVKDTSQEQEFLSIMQRMRDYDNYVYKLNKLRVAMYCAMPIQGISRFAVFAYDVLYKHMCNVVDDFKAFEATLPTWWCLNKLVLNSATALDVAKDVGRCGMIMGIHVVNDMTELYGTMSENRIAEFQDIFWVLKKNCAALRSVKVAPAIINALPGLSMYMNAKPASANKKIHNDLLEKYVAQLKAHDSFSMLKEKADLYD